MPADGIEVALDQRRCMEQALLDLQETYKRSPTQALARMIAQLEAEIAERKDQHNKKRKRGPQP